MGAARGRRGRRRLSSAVLLRTGSCRGNCTCVSNVRQASCCGATIERRGKEGRRTRRRREAGAARRQGGAQAGPKVGQGQQENCQASQEEGQGGTGCPHALQAVKAEAKVQIEAQAQAGESQGHAAKIQSQTAKNQSSAPSRAAEGGCAQARSA